MLNEHVIITCYVKHVISLPVKQIAPWFSTLIERRVCSSLSYTHMLACMIIQFSSTDHWLSLRFHFD